MKQLPDQQGADKPPLGSSENKNTKVKLKHTEGVYSMVKSLDSVSCIGVEQSQTLVVGLILELMMEPWASS